MKTQILSPRGEDKENLLSTLDRKYEEVRALREILEIRYEQIKSCQRELDAIYAQEAKFDDDRFDFEGEHNEDAGLEIGHGS